jgi:hypothetical protein
MFKINYFNRRKTKKQYLNALKNKSINSYELYKKMNNSLNNSSIISNISETTASKTIGIKTTPCTYRKLQAKDNNSFKIKKCSYLKFLELRKAKNAFPIDTNEKRFKWQNLKDEHIIIYPEIYKKAHKKQFLLKETFIDNIRGINNNKTEKKYWPKIRRLRRSNSDENKNYVQNVDIDISRRVINPEYNKEKEIISKKKSFSQNNFNYHKTNGNLESLFKLTQNEIPIKGKRLFKHNTCKSFNINIFDNGRYEFPTHTKKQFFNNNCYLDNIKEQNLISIMNKCWKIRRNRSFSPGFRTDLEFSCKRNVDSLKLRNQEIHNYKQIDVNKK